MDMTAVLPKPVKNTVSFSRFCAQLGTPLKNVRNSWCAYSPERRRAVFTAWADNFVNGRYLYWRDAGAPHQSRPGAVEMRRVIETVLTEGGEALGILCYAKDPQAHPRVRERFVEDSLLVLRFRREADGIAGYVAGEVSAAEAISGPVTFIAPAQTALDDLGAPPPGLPNPERVLGQVHSFRRDDAVRRYVIARAQGRCEYCGREDFLTLDGLPYLEAHHIIRLSQQGPDSVDNVIALCAAHHREAHYGANAEALEASFLKLVGEANRKLSR